MKPGISLFMAAAVVCALLRAGDLAAAPSWNVRDLGARGDGIAKDTAAFQKALDSCSTNGGGIVVVPEGVYLIGSIVIKSDTTLKLAGRANLVGSPDIADYPVEQIRWEGEPAEGHRSLISGRGKNITIEGSGTIMGPPLQISRLRSPRGPSLIELTDVTNAVLDGFTTEYQQLWSIHLLYGKKITARNLTIRSVNFNGDGIDVDSCSDVLIDHCNIDTGDDAISLKSGRGNAAAQQARPTENVTIKNCVLNSSIFAAIGIGSEVSGGIRNVTIEHCIISGHQNGIFLKSRDGRGGFMENITGTDLIINRSPTFLAIDLLKKGIQASDPVAGDVEKWSRLDNIRFHNIRVNEVNDLIAAKNVPVQRPVEGLSLSDISGTCSKGIVLANMNDVELTNINVTGFDGPLLTLENVKGKGGKTLSAAALAK